MGSPQLFLLSFNVKFLVAHLRMVSTLAFTVADESLYGFKNLCDMLLVCFVKANGRKCKVIPKEVACYEKEFTVWVGFSVKVYYTSSQQKNNPKIVRKMSKFT